MTMADADIRMGNQEMHEKIEAAHRQAADARARARACSDQRMQEEWTQVATMWEELASEYRELQKARAQT
jgi:hypothetical protein